MHAFTRPAVAPALHLVLALFAVLALGAVNAARAQTVTLVLGETSIAEDASGTVAVTATVSTAVAGGFTVEVSAAAFANKRPAKSDRYTQTGTTLTFTGTATTSTGTVTIDPMDNDGHTPQNNGGVEVVVSGIVSGATGVGDPTSVTLSIVESDGDGTGPVAERTGTVNGDQVVLTFDEPVVVPANTRVSLWAYRVNGGRDDRISSISTSGNEITVTLREPVSRTDEVDIRYTPPKENVDEDDDIGLDHALKDAAGNPVYAFRDIAFTNNSPPRVVLVLTPDSIGEAGGTTTVTATVDPAVTGGFTVDVAVAPDAGVTLTGTTLTFSGTGTASTGKVTITANDNDREGANPKVTVSGTFPTAVTGAFPPADVTLTITDDDAKVEEAPATVEEAPATVEEAPVARGWLARFGRMAAGQAVDALGERLRGGLRAPYAMLAGRAVSPAGRPAAERPHWDPDRGGPAAGVQRTMDAAELLRGSSVHLPLGAAEGGSAYVGPRWALWGRGSAEGFDAKDGDLAMDGDAISLTLGADANWGRVLAGVAVSHSAGEGEYAMGGVCKGPRCVGELESYVVGAYPYMRVRVNDRLSAWAMLGYGTGDLAKIEGGTGARIETGLAMKMGALGADGVILPAGPGGGFGLALRSDAMFVRTSWDRANGLEAGDADVRRLRLTLVGSRGFALASDGVVTPSVELGLRHDDGDAEIGLGVELGGAIRYANAWGLTLEARARGLVAHKDGGHKEWGAAASARLDPGATGRGLSLTFAPVWGVAPGGANGPRSLDNAGTSLAALDGVDPAARLDGELGYGFAVLRGRAVLTPYAGLSMGRAQSRTMRLGSRLRLGPNATFGFEGLRRSAHDHAKDNRFVARASLRW